MQTIWMIITNSGDGSNGITIVKDEAVMDKIRELADDGDEDYSSGDGLQDRKLKFLDDFDVDQWVNDNFYGYTTMSDLE
jgi:hypothetical protein